MPMPAAAYLELDQIGSRDLESERDRIFYPNQVEHSLS